MAFFCDYLDPVGHSAPRLASEDFTRGKLKGRDSSFSVFCESQGFPVPSYSVRLSLIPPRGSRKLGGSEKEGKEGGLRITSSRGSHPVGMSSPKFPTRDRLATDRSESTSFPLMCPAQASPPPRTRAGRILRAKVYVGGESQHTTDGVEAGHL
ncbi:hypothetical protein Pmani_014002 [Petrolisthes manimaculis]|uniref:Uncharacterized protein n=1 Tax=Petrolisthes manimaculis TaxID=1843537 RepID=A0AAE1UBJ0_9EUCA|nr:hypothetical protein Pmani_014002 [Petrolisthes manimaculis]